MIGKINSKIITTVFTYTKKVLIDTAFDVNLFTTGVRNECRLRGWNTFGPVPERVLERMLPMGMTHFWTRVVGGTTSFD